MIRFMVEYDVHQRNKDGVERNIVDARGIYFYSGTLDSRRADAVAEAHATLAAQSGWYGGWYCIYTKPRIVREYPT